MCAELPGHHIRSSAWESKEFNLQRREETVRSQTFRKRLRVLSHRLGIAPHLTPHRFRHSAATLLFEEGTDIRMVQALLEHASLRTTEIYVRVSNHALRRAMERADILRVLGE